MEPFTYVALGDSAGVGFGARDGRGYVHLVHERMRAVVPDARLVNLCISGATSDTVREQQAARAVAAKPSLVTLFIGGNDLWRGIEPRRFGRNLDAVAASLDGTGAQVLLGTVANLAHAPAAAFAEQYLGLTRATIEARTGAFNDEVTRVARAHGYAVVDLYGVGLSDAPHYFSGDGFHPSSAGYAAWADLLWPVVEQAVAFAQRGARQTGT